MSTHAREAVRSSSVSLLPSAPSCSPAGRAANDVLLPLPPLLPLMAAAVPAKELLAIQELRRRLCLGYRHDLQIELRGLRNSLAPGGRSRLLCRCRESRAALLGAVR